jgi:two-component system sensor histidine kinase QseC
MLRECVLRMSRQCVLRMSRQCVLRMSRQCVLRMSRQCVLRTTRECVLRTTWVEGAKPPAFVVRSNPKPIDMTPWRTLRGRLAGAMLAVFVLAVGASAVVDRVTGTAAETLDSEPYQDALVLAGFSLPALILIWLISSWSLRPLARASQQARAVGPLDPSARISREGLPAEITPLVDAVNGALDRMADAVDAERRFTENAAHELRTPLAVLGVRLQRARQTAEAGAAVMDWAAVEGDLARMNRLVGQLLDLARKEHARRAGVAGGLPVVNMARIAREAASVVLPLAEARGRALTVDVPDRLLVRGQHDELREALCGLLENAVLHGQGTIGVHGRLAGAPPEAVLTVSDAGPGIPESLRETVFERFRKGSHSQGTGLGLAIVREVARLHGGQVVVLPGAPCRLEFRLRAAMSAS